MFKINGLLTRSCVASTFSQNLAPTSDCIDGLMIRKTQIAFYLDDIRHRNFKRLFRQIYYDLKCSFFGKRCPLCKCKTLSPLKQSYSFGFIQQKICNGCGQDLDFIKGDEILIAKVLKMTGISKKELDRKLNL